MAEEKNELVIKDDQIIELDPYAPEYPIQLLKNGIRINSEHAEDVLGIICREITKRAPAAAQFKQASQKGFRLVVDTSDKLLDDIEKGKIKLSTEKSGKMVAQVREANGRYGKRLGIKKQVYSKGVDPVQMANSLQLRALQEQMENIESQLGLLSGRVTDVIKGQQNDRISLYYSGLALYLEAQTTTDPDLKRALLVQSLKTLSDGTLQLELTMQSDIQYLAANSYGKGLKPEMIREKMDSINRAFPVIHQATMLRAAVYCNEGELTTMATVLEEYDRFLSGPIAKHANMLAQFDERDTGTKKGIWKSRKRMRLDVADMAKQLKAPQKTIYLDMVEEKDNEEE